MKHVLCMVWTVDNEACVVYGVDWTMKHVFVYGVTVDNEACVVYGVDCTVDNEACVVLWCGQCRQ